MTLKQSAKVLAILGATVAAATLVTGCKGGGSKDRSGSDYYTQSWYNVYGSYCGSGAPKPGCNFYSDGTKIIDVEDSNYGPNNILELKTWDYYDSYGTYSTYYGWAWQSPNGIIYTDTGSALNSTDGQGRDVVADVAAQEKATVESAGKFFAAKYSLSDDVGVHVAQVLNDWATLGKSRARTDKDLADFTQRLYGVKLDNVKNALSEAQAGNDAQLTSAINEAAQNWSTTPETMKQILKDWYGDQM